MRIADRRDRMPGTEQAQQDLLLRVRSVLILIEQNHLVLLAQNCNHSRNERQRSPEPQLVAEVEKAPVEFDPPVGRHQGCNDPARASPLRHLGELGGLARRNREFAKQFRGG